MKLWQELCLAFLLTVFSLQAGYVLSSIFVSGDILASDYAQPAVTINQNNQNNQVKDIIISSNNQNGQIGQSFDYQLPNENRQASSIKELQGGKPTIIYIFAPGCGHCTKQLAQFPNFIARAEKLGFRHIGITYYGRAEYVPQLRSQYQLTSPILLDPVGKFCGSIGVGEFTLFLLGADNRIYYRETMATPIFPDNAMLQSVKDRSLVTGQNEKVINTPPVKILDLKVVPTIQDIKTDVASEKKISKLDQIVFEIMTPIETTKSIRYGLMALLVVGMFIISIKTTGSKLPVFAGGLLLLVATFYDIWQLFPANILLIATALLLLRREKFIIVPVILMMVLLSGSLLWLGSNNANLLIRMQASGWLLLPQTISSLLLFLLAFHNFNQKSVYQKAVFDAANPSTDNLHEGALAIRGVSRPERCDICHQNDQFNTESGYCSRCQRKTL